ncbi:MAG: hypothetical protein NUV75_13000, partial [Gallionella sp.]|nr:hypothetical protein [Gallionella sp.]
TPNGQPTFFAEFLHTAGLYESRVQDCPFTYTNPNAPTKYDVLGTLLLSVLSGHNRYAHITALRAWCRMSWSAPARIQRIPRTIRLDGIA